MSYKQRRRSPDGRFLANKKTLLNKSIFTKAGKGKKIFNGTNVTNFLRKILGNRIFDLYLKYLGITSLTTSTLVPFGLVLSAEYADKIIKKKSPGKFTKKHLPILDNPLVGNYLKIAGLSLLDLSPSTLLPLGIIMIIYDLAIRNLKIQKGGRLTVGSSVPPNVVQKVDAILSGQSGSPLFEAYDLLTPDLQQACSESSCTPNNISKSQDFRPKAMKVKGFQTNKITQPDTVNEVKHIRNHEVNIGDYKGNDYVLPLMTGGSGTATKGISNIPPDYEPLFADIKAGPKNALGDVVKMSSFKQFGGYNKIVNPKTGRRVNIHSSLGKRIMNKYLNYAKGVTLKNVQQGGYRFKTKSTTFSRREMNQALNLCNRRLRQLTKKQNGGASN